MGVLVGVDQEVAEGLLRDMAGIREVMVVMIMDMVTMRARVIMVIMTWGVMGVEAGAVEVVAVEMVVCVVMEPPSEVHQGVEVKIPGHKPMLMAAQNIVMVV